MTSTPEAQAGAPADVGELVKRYEYIIALNGAGAIPHLRNVAADLATALQAMQAERDAALHKARCASERHGVVVKGFMDVCEAVGVRFDAPEAVAYEIYVKIDNAEARALAAEAEADRLRSALVSRSLMSTPQTCKCDSPVIRCDMHGCRCTSCGLSEDVLRRARTATVSGEGMG